YSLAVLFRQHCAARGGWRRASGGRGRCGDGPRWRLSHAACRNPAVATDGTSHRTTVSPRADSARVTSSRYTRAPLARALGTLDARSGCAREQWTDCTPRLGRAPAARARPRWTRTRGTTLVGSSVAVGARL